MRRNLVICLSLVASIAAVYAQALDFEFLEWDDPLYVSGDSRAPDGLTLDGVAWAFSTTHAANWHPVTWLSHMLDFQLFGSDPAGHHATGVALHGLNALLLFGVLQFMTRRAWPSAFAAGLFALHPLHVESVAWVAERKDVLSTALGLLSTWTYAAFARKGGVGRYALTALLLALGLMAKPMLVTLPLVFLLLDYWPLRRGAERSVGRLVLEKLPLLALSAGSGLAAFVAQQSGGAVRSTELVPLPLRAANAVVSYARYLGKAIWPSDLSILYPHPYIPGSGGTPFALWQVGAAGALLLAISVLVLRARRRRYALVGWLWYLGTLVPVIGLVQVGGQAMADRYTYLPLIGLSLIAAWGGGDLVASLRLRHRAVEPAAAVIAVGLLAALAVGARLQARHWRDSVSLFANALETAPGSPVLHHNLGRALHSRGRLDEAIERYREALRARPDYLEAQGNLASALLARGEIEGAIRHYRRALRIDPRDPRVLNGLGTAFQSRGELDEAIRQYRRSVEIDPQFAEALFNLGIAYQLRGRPDEAVDSFQRALRIEPGNADIHNNLGIAYQSRGEPERGIAHLRRAVELRPGDAGLRFNLGNALQDRARIGEAIEEYRRALAIRPDFRDARDRLELALRRSAGPDHGR